MDKCSPWSILTKNLNTICIISHLCGKNSSVKLSGFDILFVGNFFLRFNTFNRCTTLAWKIPWMEEPGGLQSMGLLRVGHD